MNLADIAFIIICTGLVMLMTPGLALFYGGLVRSRNVLSTTMHSFITMGIVPVLWFVVGYSLAFGPDLGGIIGGFSHVLLRGVDMEGAGAASGIPPLLFMLFQCMFAVLTLALISGSYAERIHFPAMLLFSILWLLFVYCPMAHWVWDGGWMAKMGAVDFAGGAVVHMASAAGGLAAARTLGPRLGLGRKSFAPHNLPLTLLGGGILWFGWFGFNAGGAYAADKELQEIFERTYMPWSPHRWPLLRASWAGCWWNGSMSASPQASARPRVHWRAWWPSLRQRDSWTSGLHW